MRRILTISILLQVVQPIVFTLNHPENVTIKWRDDEITVYCNHPNTNQYGYCYKMKLRFKSNNKQDWEKPIVSEACDDNTAFFCKFHTANLYREKCYRIGLQFLGLNSCYGQLIESTWSYNISLANGVISDNCMKIEEASEDSISYKFLILLYVPAAFLLVVIVTTTFTCTMKRLKKRMLPLIPDPKHMFYGLFEDYKGNFQEWTKISGNETKQEQLECSEDGDIIEEYNEEEKHIHTKQFVSKDECKEEIHTQEKEYRALTEIPLLTLEQMKNIVVTSSVVENSSDICIGNTLCTMRDSAYIML
uniref:Cytokine receptor-like factor 2-like D2 domain-containing protein n=1 Tax=Leptobrachium leishanense TaxID=445787 RepID=A0A8C5M4R3_9ANUR